jgi:hypothetical protein
MSILNQQLGALVLVCASLSLFSQAHGETVLLHCGLFSPDSFYFNDDDGEYN